MSRHLKSIDLFIPGKVMLAGEYSVLRGGHALAVTLACGMRVQIEIESLSSQWVVSSDLWTEAKVIEEDQRAHSDILCRAVQFAAKQTGFRGGRVTVTSDLDITYGIGSSSALRLGVCGAFLALQHNSSAEGGPSKISKDAMAMAWQLQSENQGTASGYDIATQYLGGVVEFSYEIGENKWKPHWFRHDIEALNLFVHVFVGGHGAPTKQTMQSVLSWLENANRMDKFIDASECLVDALNTAQMCPDRPQLKGLMRCCGVVRTMFAHSPQFPQDIHHALQSVAGIDGSWSWKTTGAGGEDAVLLFGMHADIKKPADVLREHGWMPLQFGFSNGGVRIVKFDDDMPVIKPSDYAPRSRSFL